MIVFTFSRDGGFIAGDTDTELTAYAFRTSWFACRAVQKPAAAAVAMLANESPSLPRPPGFDARNWAELNVARFPEIDGIVHLPASAIVKES